MELFTGFAIGVLTLVSLQALTRFINQYIENKKPKPPGSELNEFIHELTKGSAIVRIIPVDANSIFLRSPRDMR